MGPSRDSLSVMLQNDPFRSELLRKRLSTVHRWSADLLNSNVKDPSGCLLNSLGRSEGDVDTYVQQLQQREQQTASTACTAIWKPGVLAYRCRTCQVNDNCAVCQECFQAGNHTNHDYSMYFSFAGGCCDCGDPTSWKPSGFCPKHTGQTNRQQDTAQLDAIEGTIAMAVLSWAVQELCRAVYTSVKPADGSSPSVDQTGAKVAAMCLLPWLQKLCAVPVLRTLIGDLLLKSAEGLLAAVQPLVDYSHPLCSEGDSFPPESTSQQIGKWSLDHVALDCLLDKFAQVPPDVMQEMMTLILQLLFEPHFKRIFTEVLLGHYSQLMEEWAVKPLEAVMPLDMITVQLFNDEGGTRAVEGLLQSLMAALFKLTSTSVIKQATSPTQFTASKTYTRILQDIKTVLAHPWAVRELLAEQLPVLMDTVALLDSFMEHQRKLGTHAEWPDDTWLNPVQVEVMLFGQAMLPILSGVLSERHLDMPLPQLCQIVLSSVKLVCQQSQQDQEALYATDHASSGRHCGSCCIWNHLITGGLVSIHLPKQRAVALLVKALLGLHAQAMVQGNPADIQDCTQLMEQVTAAVVAPVESGQPLQVPVAAISYQALAQSVLMLQVWRAQVQTGMWTRNGREVAQLLHVYQSYYWSDTSLSLDLLSLQLWLAHAGCDQVLADFMRSFGGEAITQAAWQLAGLAPLLPCPALTGTEIDPHAALHALHLPSTSQNSTTMYTAAIPHEIRSGLVRQAAEGGASAAAVPADPRQRQPDRNDSRAASDLTQCTDNSQSDPADAMQPDIFGESGSAGQHETAPGGLVGPGWVQKLFGADSAPLQEPQLVCIVQGMRLLVTLLRERHTYEPDVRRQIRWHVVHRLCHKDCTYTELQDVLPSHFSPHHQAFDQVLAEVATFVTPSTLHRGHYTLKKDMWAEFDPFFPQYTPLARQAAINRGLEQKLWKPHQQLRGFADSLPAGLNKLRHVPSCAFSVRLVRVCLAYSQRHPSTAADDLATAAISLLALAVQAGREEGCEAPDVALIQSMVQTETGNEAWQGSSLLEQLQTIKNSEAGQRSFELQDCAAHMHSKLAQLAQHHNLLNHGPASEAVTLQDSPGSRAGNASEGGSATDAAAKRRAQAKARQAAMMAKMRQQQAHFTDKAAHPKPDEKNSKDEDMAEAQAGPSTASQEQQQQSVESCGASAAALGAELHAEALEGECALCGSGNEAEPLGWVAQVHCCAVASFVQQPPPAWQDTPCNPPHPAAWQAGASFLDEQAGPSVLCCGHMLHTSCLETHRLAVSLQQADDLEAAEQLDLRQREFLCPVCRRLGTALLPALAPKPVSSHMVPSQTLSGWPDEAIPQQAGPAGSTDDSSLHSQLEAVVQTVDDLVPADTFPPVPTNVFGEHRSQAFSIVRHAHKLMESTAQSIISQNGVREREEDSRTAEGDTAVGNQGSEEQAGAAIVHPTAAVLVDADEAAEIYTQEWQSIYGHYGHYHNGINGMVHPAHRAQVAWATWAHNVAAWEVQHRPPGVCVGSDAEAISNAQWRGMQALAVVCLAFGTGHDASTDEAAKNHSVLLAQLRWLTATTTHEDSVQHSVGFRQNLSPLMNLQQRATQFQQPSGHSLFSRAGGKPPSPAPAASAAADPLPLASHAETNSKSSLECSDSRGTSSNKAASTSQASRRGAHDEEHSTDGHTLPSRESAATAPDTVMSHGDAGSDDFDAANVSAEGAQQADGFSEIGARAAYLAYLRDELAGLGEDQSVEDLVLDSIWQLDAQTHAGHPEQKQLVKEWQQLVRDPFALLMHLLAFVQCPQDSTDPDRGACMSAVSAAAAAGDRVKAFQALVRLVYVIAVAQAAHFRRLSGEATPAQGVNGMLGPHLLPFLRRAHIMQSLITSATASDARATLPFCQQTQDIQAGAESSHQDTDSMAALEALLGMFALPQPAAIMASLKGDTSSEELLHRWVHFPAVLPANDQLEQKLQQRKQALPKPHLMQLPNQFQELFLQLVEVRCSHCGRPPKEGALCLQCGAFMCAADPKCRNIKGGGHCKSHALACGGGTCAFLLMKMTKVLLISASRACLAPSPYLDTHGEEDLYLHRGRPLYLNQQRSLRLNQLWAASAFDFDSPTFHDASGGSAWRAAQDW